MRVCFLRLLLRQGIDVFKALPVGTDQTSKCIVPLDGNPCGCLVMSMFGSFLRLQNPYPAAAVAKVLGEQASPASNGCRIVVFFGLASAASVVAQVLISMLNPVYLRPLVQNQTVPQAAVDTNTTAADGYVWIFSDAGTNNNHLVVGIPAWYFCFRCGTSHPRLEASYHSLIEGAVRSASAAA